MSVWLIRHQTQVIHNSDKWRRVLKVSLSHADASKQLYKLSCQMGPEGRSSSPLAPPLQTKWEIARQPRTGLLLSRLPTFLKKNFFNLTNACHLKSYQGKRPRTYILSNCCILRTNAHPCILWTVKNTLFTDYRMQHFLALFLSYRNNYIVLYIMKPTQWHCITVFEYLRSHHIKNDSTPQGHVE